MAQGPVAQNINPNRLYTVPVKEKKSSSVDSLLTVLSNPGGARHANEAGAADFWRSGVAELEPGSSGSCIAGCCVQPGVCHWVSVISESHGKCEKQMGLN